MDLNALKRLEEELDTEIKAITDLVGLLMYKYSFLRHIKLKPTKKLSYPESVNGHFIYPDNLFIMQDVVEYSRYIAHLITYESIDYDYFIDRYTLYLPNERKRSFLQGLKLLYNRVKRETTLKKIYKSILNVLLAMLCIKSVYL